MADVLVVAAIWLALFAVAVAVSTAGRAHRPLPRRLASQACRPGTATSRLPW